MALRLVRLADVKRNKRREVVFGVDETQVAINGYEKYLSRRDSVRKTLKSRFEHWVDGNICDRYYHGWHDPTDWRPCFSFRWNEASQHHRLYGFICHPAVLTPDFEVCVLLFHAQKNKWNTDPRIMSQVLALKDGTKLQGQLESQFASLDEENKDGSHRNGPRDKAERVQLDSCKR